MIYLRLFYEFFKTGLFAIGGGLATVPFLSDMAERTGWFTQLELANMIAVSESTPGPIGVNMATYAGFSCGGILGAVVATLGLIAPSIIIILIVAGVLAKFKEKSLMPRLMLGVRAASLGLIAAAWYGIANLCLFQAAFSAPNYIVFSAIFVLCTFVPKAKNLHPLFYVLIGGICGIAFL